MTPFITILIFISLSRALYLTTIHKLSHPNECLLISFKTSKTINFLPHNEAKEHFVEISFKALERIRLKQKCLLPVCFWYIYVK